MGYLGTKPANSPLTSELIPDGMIGTSDLANGAVTQDKLSTYIAPKGTPAFSALLSSNQTITTSTFTKLAFATEVFDTNSNFDTSTYRFTPTVAGYYQVNACVYASTSVTQTQAAIYKNGVLFARQVIAVASSSSMVASLMYLNGTTDYIECYGLLVGTTPAVASSSDLTFFQASMVRAA